MPSEVSKEEKALQQGYAYRMSLQLRLQHIFFALCILVLAITGLALYFSDTYFGHWLIALEGGFENRGLIHRIAAAGLILSVVYHLAFSLFSKSGSADFRKRMINARDFRLFFQAVRYAADDRGEPPAVGKFTLGQKVHYWLAGFLSVTMIVSGLALWNPTVGMMLLPQWLMSVLLVLHGYEGVLIFIVVVLWHIYSVHLSPKNFPGSSVWLNGRMPLDKVKQYHRAEYERLTAPQEGEHE
jgi:formate dehydrogenase subunit gamma